MMASSGCVFERLVRFAYRCSVVFKRVLCLDVDPVLHKKTLEGQQLTFVSGHPFYRLWLFLVEYLQ
ncbi:MAG: hypothetical protein ACKVIF_13535, partial [Rhodospirillales bacterium]